MGMKEHADESVRTIKTALAKYRLDKLTLEDAEQAAHWVRKNDGGVVDDPAPLLAERRASVKRQRRELIRLQNDRFRVTLTDGEVYMTGGVQGRGGAFVQACLGAVRCFTTFNADNDPYGEDDFGVLQIEGQKVH